jgi:hypothetical protein
MCVQGCYWGKWFAQAVLCIVMYVVVRERVGNQWRLYFHLVGLVGVRG